MINYYTKFIQIILFINVLLILFSFGEVQGPITNDFKEWLDNNGYKFFNYSREEFGKYGSYGGKKTPTDKITKIPIIFVHGNSDGALKMPGIYSTGFSKTIEYFESNGYTSSELYVTTWGDRNTDNAGTRTHSCEFVQYIRNFMEAVIRYTGSDFINIISHSMGVTLARKAIIGTMLIDILDTRHSCIVGKPLEEKVNVFIGLSGANYGICSCSGPEAALEATCNNLNGFFPGDKCQSYIPINNTIPPDVTSCNDDHTKLSCLKPAKYSKILYDMNNSQTGIGKNVFSFWSLDDELLGSCSRVWGRPTAFIPNSSGVRVFSKLGHEQVKDNTIMDQYSIIYNFEK
uniref:Lipase domain-containing protein n=1 Tax=Strongyloides papillosus TaxID=174720 RepID=A0A0N5CAP8_STREA